MSVYEPRKQLKTNKQTKTRSHYVEISWPRTNYVDESGLELTATLGDKQLLKPQH